MTEAETHLKVVEYIRNNYPDLLFRTDFAAGIKMTPGQAKKHKALQKCRAWPDLFIAESFNKTTFGKARKSSVTGTYKFGCALSVPHLGLFIELKKPDVKIFRKDGELVADEHVREQAAVLEALRNRGYAAEFAVGFDEAKQLIDQCYGQMKTSNVHKGEF